MTKEICECGHSKRHHSHPSGWEECWDCSCEKFKAKEIEEIIRKCKELNKRAGLSGRRARKVIKRAKELFE